MKIKRFLLLLLMLRFSSIAALLSLPLSLFLSLSFSVVFQFFTLHAFFIFYCNPTAAATIETTRAATAAAALRQCRQSLRIRNLSHHMCKVLRWQATTLAWLPFVVCPRTTEIPPPPFSWLSLFFILFMVNKLCVIFRQVSQARKRRRRQRLNCCHGWCCCCCCWCKHKKLLIWPRQLWQDNDCSQRETSAAHPARQAGRQSPRYAASTNL